MLTVFGASIWNSEKINLTKILVGLVIIGGGIAWITPGLALVKADASALSFY